MKKAGLYFLFCLLWGTAYAANPGGNMGAPPSPQLITLSVVPSSFVYVGGVLNCPTIQPVCLTDNIPIGTVVATASVIMSGTSGDPFQGFLRVVDPITGVLNPNFAVSGLNIITNRTYAPSNDGNTVTIKVLAWPNQ